MDKYQETIIRFKKYKELANDISKLQKALDKACELLSIYATNEEDGVEEQIHTSDEWKELFLGGKE